MLETAHAVKTLRHTLTTPERETREMAYVLQFLPRIDQYDTRTAEPRRNLPTTTGRISHFLTDRG